MHSEAEEVALHINVFHILNRPCHRLNKLLDLCEQSSVFEVLLMGVCGFNVEIHLTNERSTAEDNSLEISPHKFQGNCSKREFKESHYFSGISNQF